MTKKINNRCHWAINYSYNYNLQIMNTIEPNKGIITWQRGRSKAILDYVYIHIHAIEQYCLKIIPTGHISDHELLYLTAKVNPTRKVENPNQMIIFAKWK